MQPLVSPQNKEEGAQNSYYPNLGYTSGHTCSKFGLHYPLDKSAIQWISNGESIYLHHLVDREVVSTFWTTGVFNQSEVLDRSVKPSDRSSVWNFYA